MFKRKTPPPARVHIYEDHGRYRIYSLKPGEVLSVKTMVKIDGPRPTTDPTGATGA